jgi:hypothetical protein
MWPPFCTLENVCIAIPGPPWSNKYKIHSLNEQTGQYYNGRVLNLFPDGGAGMCYHMDPTIKARSGAMRLPSSVLVRRVSLSFGEFLSKSK